MVQLTMLSEKFPSKQNIMTDLELYTKLSTLPPEMKKEVGLFIDFLTSKVKQEKVTSTRRKAGLAKGLIKMREDFDEPLEDFKDYME